MRWIVESIYLTYIYQSSCGHVKALHALGKKKHPYMEHLGGGSAGGELGTKKDSLNTML